MKSCLHFKFVFSIGSVPELLPDFNGWLFTCVNVAYACDVY